MNRVGTVILDLDGVVYLGSTPIPGAADTISHLLETGWQVLYATNNSVKTPASVARTLGERAGIPVDETTVVTSGMAATSYLTSQGIESALVVGSPQLEQTVRDGGIRIESYEVADSVVVGLDRELSYDTIDKAARAVRRGAAFVATNTDATYPTPRGMAPGAGTIVAAVATASGAPYVACGKPHQPMTDLVDALVASDNVWMVGDRPETDVAFAMRSGWTSVLALTGVVDEPESVPQEHRPDHIIESLAALPDVLAEYSPGNPHGG